MYIKKNNVVMIIKVYIVHNICIKILVLNNSINNTIALVLGRYTNNVR